MKSIVGLLVEGNYFCGYPAAMTSLNGNQEGTSPWTRTEDITIQNNYFYFDNYPANIGNAMDFTLVDGYNSAQPGSNILVTNNLIRGQELLFKGGGGDTVVLHHNTIINDMIGVSYHSIVSNDSPTTGWVFRDNIGDYRLTGAACIYGARGNPPAGPCWPSGVWSKNVIVDSVNGGVAADYWGSGSMLAPKPTSFAQVGFIDQAGGNYRLSPSSNYYGDGTGGSNPGIDQDALEAALGFSISGDEAPSVKLIAICI